jgi:CheY-like chemotaxis protein
MVLVVDDFPTLCDAVRKLLAHSGLDTVCAYSAHEAKQIMAAGVPAVVVLDNAMPGKTGLELLREMKSDARLSEVPVLMFSASDDQQEIQEARALGAVDWIVKGNMPWSKFIETISTLHP